MPESSLEQKAGENFFGDVVVYESNTWESKTLSYFTGTKTNHCALRISENEAESSDLWAWVKNRDFLKHNLMEPERYVDSYQILRHTEITPEKRESMKSFYEKVGKEYDLLRILKLAVRHVRGIEKDMTDLTTNPNEALYYYSRLLLDKFGHILERRKGDNKKIMVWDIDDNFKRHDCSALCAMVHEIHQLGKVINDVHYSQIEPHHFLNNPKYEIIGEWKRPKKLKKFIENLSNRKP